MLFKKKKSWKHMEMKPLRLINSISCRLCPKGPAVTLPRHFHCQERTWPWENVSWVAYLQLMNLLFSNVFCPLACYLCCHAKSRGLDLLKIWEIRKRWPAEKVGNRSTWCRLAFGCNGGKVWAWKFILQREWRWCWEETRLINKCKC